jgi:hypothetical protein
MVHAMWAFFSPVLFETSYFSTRARGREAWTRSLISVPRMRGIALHRLPFSELMGFEFCSIFSRTLYCVVSENRTKKPSNHAGSSDSVLMFYGFERVWVFLAKSVESKGGSANAEKHRKRDAYTLFP